MKIFNSYTNALETFVSRHPGVVSMYVCGPTVYNYIHIGNARPVVIFDTVRRYFTAKGNRVQFVSNFTDVDDKIIAKAKEQGKDEATVSQFYIDAFLHDVEALGSSVDYIQPRVTRYVDKIIDYIADLVKAGDAYEIDGDVYFRVSKSADYGRLSNRKLDDLISGARVEVNEKKESPLDFTLWKKTAEGLRWDSPFSVGRPGWHTECVAMIDDIFGEEIDIHGGGMDLMFPHHENEIAQACAHDHHRVARFWMHNGRLDIGGEKMSKSLGNDIKVKDLEGDLRGFRLYLLATHYRAPLSFSLENLESYQKDWSRDEKTVQTLFRTLDRNRTLTVHAVLSDPEIAATLTHFDEAMENDFNTPNALTAFNALLKIINNLLRRPSEPTVMNQALEAARYMLGILGLEPVLKPLDDEDRALFVSWEDARKTKDFAAADRFRAELVRRDLI
ncbi:MAG: cysteine--tRNA ligase [Bacillota bacterium]|nr:cysteine--tRNA ligase [Bacillota bacterium]